MRRKIISAGVALMVVLLVTATILVNKSSAGSQRLVKKDIPKHGLVIVGQADKEFKGLRNALLKKHGGIVAERLPQPYVFVKNTGARRVVAYTLKWEMSKDDGTVATRVQSYTNVDALRGKGVPDDDGAVLRPKRSRLFSLYGWADGQESPQADGADDAAIPVAERVVAENQFYDRLEQEGALRGAREELAHVVSVSVSIDGAFFEDGTFVGSNTTKSFERGKAQASAKHDMLRWLAELLLKGQSPAEVMKAVEEMNKSLPAPEVSPEPGVKFGEAYNYYRKLYQQELLDMRAGIGDDGEALQRLFLQNYKSGRLSLKKAE